MLGTSSLWCPLALTMQTFELRSSFAYTNGDTVSHRGMAREGMPKNRIVSSDRTAQLDIFLIKNEVLYSLAIEPRTLLEFPMLHSVGLYTERTWQHDIAEKIYCEKRLG